MNKYKRLVISRLNPNGQSGQALIIVLIFLLLGSILLVPALDRIGTALKTNVKYEDKSDSLYAADAGIDDGIWQVKYGGLQTKFGGEDNYEYDFTSNASYQLDNPINGYTTNVTIQNVWIPSNITLGSLNLSANDAKSIIDDGKLVVSGTAGAVVGQPYRIKIDFIPATGDNLTISSVGVWLPEGFTFISGNSTLELSGHSYTKIPGVTNHCGGQAIVWQYTSPYPLFSSFPNLVSDNGTQTSTIYFSYTPPASDPTKMPTGIAWVTTQMADASGVAKTDWQSPSNVPISWDVDTRIFKIDSVAGDTRVEVYTSKRELHTLGDAASGDYVAVGNSLMYDASHSPPPDTGVRDTILSSSDAVVSAIPSNGDVLNAYLYWSAWRNDPLTAFSDTCSSSNLTNSWTSGSDWSYYSSGADYRGQHTGADANRYLTVKNGLNLSGYPSGSMFTLEWDQDTATLSDLFSDTCTSTNLATYWTNGGDWQYDSSKYYKGEHTGASDPARYLTLTGGQNLYGYSNATISWSQWKTGTLDANDYLYFNISSDNGTTWSSNVTAGSSANLTGSKVTFTYTIPAGYFTTGVKIRFYIAGFGSGKYCNLDDFKITPKYSSSDGLDFALWDGTNWSGNIQAFRGSTSSTYSYDLTGSTQYLINGFKFRFYLVGMTGSGAYCYLDNIQIIVKLPDVSVVFKINGQQVSLDSSGEPQLGGEVTSDNSQVLVNTTGFSYACKADVSKLVKTYPIVPGELHHNGNTTYTVGSVTATTSNQLSYAGWSLVIVYFSPSTAGHYLYLRDVFSYNSGGHDLDFDNDGTSGGDVTGFVIPEPIRDQSGNILETNAAKLTCFVGEGDWCYGGDYVALNAPDGLRSNPTDYTTYESYKLWDGVTLNTPTPVNTASNPDNVWNGMSAATGGSVVDGVDIDTFNITWASQLLKPGDNKLHLDLYTQTDNWNFVYLILSVRSKVTVGGTNHYIISDNG
jgi:hypothetical protein